MITPTRVCAQPQHQRVSESFGEMADNEDMFHECSNGAAIKSVDGQLFCREYKDTEWHAWAELGDMCAAEIEQQDIELDNFAQTLGCVAEPDRHGKLRPKIYTPKWLEDSDED